MSACLKALITNVICRLEPVRCRCANGTFSRSVSQGLTNGQIADQLSLTVHGVKFHLASIFRKLGVDNRTSAAALYLSESRGRTG